MEDYKIAVFTSGMSRGSNFEAMVNVFKGMDLPITIEFVLITRRNAPIKERCERLGIPVYYAPTKDWNSFEEKVISRCRESNLDLVALAGFMKQITPHIIDGIGCPMLNIHPALLPNYGGKGMFGMNVHKAVFADGCKESGVTVHQVNDAYDEGDIVAQEQVDITKCSSPEEIAKTVLKIEHSLYGRAIWSFLKK